MKGVISTLQMLILSLIALTIGIIFVQVASKNDLYAMAKEGKNIIGSPGDITQKTNPIPTTIKPVTPEHVYSSLKNSDPFYPSEIACFISDKIFNDYSAFGPITLRGADKALPINVESRYSYYYLGSGLFKLTYGNSKELSWENELTDRGCQLCKNATNFVVPELDEICLNANLNRTLGTTTTQFCHGQFFDPSNPSNGQVAFSNCWCSNQNNGVGGWGDYCNGWHGTGWCNFGAVIDDWCNCGIDKNKEFCDNEQGGNLDYAHDMVKWCVPNASTSTLDLSDKYLYDINELLGGECYQNLYSNEINTLTLGDNVKIPKDPFLMLYGVFWIPEMKRYQVEFNKIPAIKKESDAWSAISLSDRHNLLGYQTPKVRRSADRILIPSADTSIGDLMQKAKIALANKASESGFYGGVRITSAIDFEDWHIEGSCEEVPLNEFCIKSESCTGHSETGDKSCIQKLVIPQGNGLGTDGSILTFRIDDTIENGILKANKMYRVVSSAWYYKYCNKDYCPESFTLYPIDMVDRMIGIYPISDETINGCCQGKLSLSFEYPTDPKVGKSNKLIASGLNYCDKNSVANGKTRGTVYFYDTPCSGHTPGDNSPSQKGSCDVSNEEETLNCLADETSAVPKSVGCNVTFTTPSVGTHTYYACTDKDGDDKFTSDGESTSATLTVNGCPGTCEPTQMCGGSCFCSDCLDCTTSPSYCCCV